MKYQFLSIEDVIEINHDQVSLYGGSFGLRDLGLLESATKAPESTFDGKYLNSFPFEMAAAYLVAICLNHPFIDGNKRTAYAAALVFLDWHDIQIEPPEEEAFDFVVKVAEGVIDKAEAASFLERHSRYNSV